MAQSTIPCECWESSGIGDMNGTEYCKVCSAKRYRDRDAENKPPLSFQESVAEEVKAKMAIKREKQRVVNTRLDKCAKKDCGWFNKSYSTNCFRDPGDCRYDPV